MFYKLNKDAGQFYLPFSMPGAILLYFSNTAKLHPGSGIKDISIKNLCKILQICDI